MPPEPRPAACEPTLELIQAVLDGAAPPAALDADPHPPACAACRDRAADARVLLAALAAPVEPVAVPARFAGSVLTAVRADRRARYRQRLVFTVGSGLAVAAAVLVAAWAMNRTPEQKDFVETPAPPAPVEVAPAPRPVRVSAELAKAGDAFRESSRPFTDPVAAAPKAVAAIAEAMIPAAVVPMPDDMAPVAVSLADLPAAARTGLEPVAGTTQKAFTRLFRDVGAFASARPKS
jgi:hypothetical protein